MEGRFVQRKALSNNLSDFAQVLANPKVRLQSRTKRARLREWTRRPASL